MVLGGGMTSMSLMSKCVVVMMEPGGLNVSAFLPRLGRGKGEVVRDRNSMYGYLHNQVPSRLEPVRSSTATKTEAVAKRCRSVGAWRRRVRHTWLTAARKPAVLLAQALHQFRNVQPGSVDGLPVVFVPLHSTCDVVATGS